MKIREWIGGLGKLFQSGKLIVRVYANDHLPPHFHAITPDQEALIEISTKTVLAGNLSPKTKRLVMDWAEVNSDALIEEWNRINARFPIARS